MGRRHQREPVHWEPHHHPDADDNGDLTAIIDGENQATIDRAVGYLNWGKEAGSHLEVLREGPTEPTPTPTRARGAGRPA